ncbi:MAG: SPOR domain-containing protein [Xanthomonadaceae bacterium]|nr:SPOR domain-containing protein [Xanthomonadaceae bacterium]
MDTPLKQRLIGAAVLIALAVFFLPMLVKGPAPDSGVSDVSTDIPDGPEGAGQSRDLPLAAPGDVPQGGAVGMDATPVDRPAADAPTLTTPTGDTAAAPADPAAATDASGAAALPPTAAGGNYAVHFGAYATQKNAETVAGLVKKSQLPAYSEPATVGGKAAWRVRIGPFATRADAESARLKALEVRSDVPVRVVVLDAESAPATPAVPASDTPTTPVAPAAETPKPVAAKPSEPAEAKPAAPKPVLAKPAPTKPAEPAPKPVATAAKPAETKPAAPKPTITAPTASSTPSTTTAKPTVPKPAAAKPADSGTLVAVAPKPKPATTAATAKVGFAVQLGAFSAAADATALRDRLRASGFAAFTETVSTDKGKLTRVRVGPVIDRAAADQLKAQVKAKTGVDGIVRPHP